MPFSASINAFHKLIIFFNIAGCLLAFHGTLEALELVRQGRDTSDALNCFIWPAELWVSSLFFSHALFRRKMINISALVALTPFATLALELIIFGPTIGGCPKGRIELIG